MLCPQLAQRPATNFPHRNAIWELAAPARAASIKATPVTNAAVVVFLSLFCLAFLPLAPLRLCSLNLPIIQLF